MSQDEDKFSRIQHHEHVHVRQVEDRMLLSLGVGLVVAFTTGDWWLGLALWASGGAWQIPNFVTAVLRYGLKGVYLGTEHELSAYAQTDARTGGKSWLETHRERHL